MDSMRISTIKCEVADSECTGSSEVNFWSNEDYINQGRRKQKECAIDDFKTVECSICTKSLCHINFANEVGHCVKCHQQAFVADQNEKRLHALESKINTMTKEKLAQDEKIKSQDDELAKLKDKVKFYQEANPFDKPVPSMDQALGTVESSILHLPDDRRMDLDTPSPNPGNISG